MAASGQGERRRRARAAPNRSLSVAQQIAFDRVRLAGLWDYVWPSDVGPRVAEPALLLIDPYPWSAPHEELRLRK